MLRPAPIDPVPAATRLPLGPMVFAPVRVIPIEDFLLPVQVRQLGDVRRRGIGRRQTMHRPDGIGPDVQLIPNCPCFPLRVCRISGSRV